MTVTKLRSKGQIVLPKILRDAHKWRPGTEFAIEEAKDGLLLRPLRLFPPTRLEDVMGRLRYKGKPKTLSQMDKAIGEAVKERHDRGRY